MFSYCRLSCWMDQLEISGGENNWMAAMDLEMDALGL